MRHALVGSSPACLDTFVVPSYRKEKYVEDTLLCVHWPHILVQQRWKASSHTSVTKCTSEPVNDVQPRNLLLYAELRAMQSSTNKSCIIYTGSGLTELA